MQANFVPERSPNSSLLNKVMRFPLQEALKFLPAHDMIHFYQASRYCKWVAKDDYLWRFLSEQLPLFERHENEMWKDAYLRCKRIPRLMSREQGKWNYEMCPIRHFRQNVVKLLASHSNYVLAVDAAGSFAVFWIDETDQENDEDSLQTQTQELREEPIAMYVYPAE